MKANLNLLSGTADDVVLRTVVEGVSQEIDGITNRSFQPVTATRTFSGDGGAEMFVPDLVSVTTLKEDNGGDGTFDTTWDATDFVLAPYNADPTRDGGRPYVRIEVSMKSNGSQDVFLRGQQNYQVIGTWGFNSVVGTTGLDGTLDGTATTTMTFSGQVGTTIAVGHSLRYITEVVYVTEVATTTSTAVTVNRAQFGSTATAGTAIAVNKILYPPAIGEATFIQTARLWRRKDSAFASEAGLLESGQLVTFSGGLVEDVKQLIGPFRKPAIGFPV